MRARHLRQTASAIAVVLIFVMTAAADTIYTWTDKDGVRHMTNVPPVEYGREVETMEVKPPQVVGEPEVQLVQPADRLQTEVAIINDHVIVPVEISYRKKMVKARLLLDTGATNITLHRHIAEKLSVENPEKRSIRVAGGELLEAGAVVLDSVTVGPHTKENLMAGIIEYSGPAVAFDGMLGMNFLRNLGYSVDSANRVIRWH